MYVLRLDPDGRVLEVMDPKYKTEDTPEVSSYPESALYDYRYVDGAYVYDPLPESQKPSVWDDLAAAIREGVNSV